MKFIDRTGMVFGRLTVLGRDGTSMAKKTMWLCRCECGKQTRVDACSLRTGNTTSCGCYLQERITKHGGYGKGSYNTWRAMMRRCYQPRDKDYCSYGARGVIVFAPWHDYIVFAAAVGEPVGDQTLDRVDVEGDYVPGNVRWASVLIQNRNCRQEKQNSSGHIGISKTAKGWRAHLGAFGRSYSTRVFPSLDQALEARKAMENKYWTAA